MNQILVGQGVCKHFGGLKAVDEVDFHLDEGEILGLIGPNGAGKTTLFSVAAGSIPTTRGTVWLQGERVSGRSAHRSVHLGITRTHQIVRPFARLTVLENLLVGHYYGRPQAVTGVAQDRAMEILDFIGLGDRAQGPAARRGRRGPEPGREPAGRATHPPDPRARPIHHRDRARDACADEPLRPRHGP